MKDSTCRVCVCVCGCVCVCVCHTEPDAPHVKNNRLHDSSAPCFVSFLFKVTFFYEKKSFVQPIILLDKFG